MVPRAVLMKSGLVSVNTARQVNVAHSKTTVNVARLMSYLSKIAHSTVKRPIHKNTIFKNSNFNQSVNIVRDKNVNIARSKAVVKAVKGNNVNDVKPQLVGQIQVSDGLGPQKKLIFLSNVHGSLQIDLQDKGVIDSGCLRHMIRNMSYLTDYEEIDGGYVDFGGNPKGGKITGKDHLGKFDCKADECFFVGYSLNSKAFRVFNSRTRIVEENLHIRFSENTPNIVGIGPDWLFDIDALTRTMNYESIVVGTQSNGFESTKASDNAGQAIKETYPIKNYILLQLWPADPPYSQDPKCSHDDGFNPLSDDGKSTNTINAASTNKDNVVGGKTSIKLLVDLNMPELEDYSIFEDDENVGAEADMNNLDTTIQVSPNPTTRIHKDHPRNQVIGYLQSATQTRNKSKNLEEHGFIEAMQEELLQFKLQEVWTLVDLPNGKRAIGTKWVFRNKKDERRIMIRNKARLVTQGYTQEEGIDYDEVFAPVARIKAIRLFLAYASFKDFVVYQMDVKSDFLYGKIEEEVYVCQPPGFEDLEFPDRVYKVEKALYGLHQAYSLEGIKLMHEKFQMSSIGELTFFLGLQVKQKKDGIFISQDKYVGEILKKFRSMIGLLMYLTSLRPDIMFTVCAYARYQVNPMVSHLHAVKRIYRYLKGQPKLGLWYLKDSPFDLVAYTDNDYARASLDRKSTTGGC
ncbi:putative ribonuclease H-like domain-containing protein [Tanacetum coccineum]